MTVGSKIETKANAGFVAIVRMSDICDVCAEAPPSLTAMKLLQAPQIRTQQQDVERGRQASPGDL